MLFWRTLELYFHIYNTFRFYSETTSCATEAEQVDDAPAAPEVLDLSSKVALLDPLVEIQSLQAEVARLKAIIRAKNARVRLQRKRQKKESCQIRRKAAALDALVHRGVLTQGQISALLTRRRPRFTRKEVSVALGLNAISPKAHNYVTKVMGLPLPSASTLSRRTRGFRVNQGMIEAAVAVLESVVPNMEPLERLCVVAFDEMALDQRYCHDTTVDQVLAGSKLQVAMARGLCSSWKQPVYYELDTPMTAATLSTIIGTLEALQLRVVATTSDMGPDNQRLWKDLGVTDSRTWFENPAEPARLVLY